MIRAKTSAANTIIKFSDEKTIRQIKKRGTKIFVPRHIF